MSKLYNHLKNDSDSIRLSEAEKNAMRMRLEQALFVPPSHGTKTESPYMWMFAPRSLALAGIAFILIASSGTAYAAEGSLPGAPLYSVKTKVIEPIKIALAASPAAKAEANAKIAVLRVQEAETLAAQGTLTEEVAEEISNNYRAHADAALALVTEVSVQDTTASSTVIATAVSIETDEPKDDAPEAPKAKTFAAKISLTAQSTVSSTTSSSTPIAASTTVAKNSINPAQQPSDSAKASQPGSASGISTSAATSSKAMFVQKIRTSLMEQDRILEGINAEVREKKSNRRHR